MDAKFMNSENSQASDPQKLLLNLSVKIKLKRSDKYVALSNLSIYYTWKNIKKSYNNNKSKISDPTWNLNYLMDHILYQKFKIILNIPSKNHEKITDNPSIRIYINKIENKVTFKIKPGYYFELLTPEKTKLLGSTERNIT